ncbi:MAG TPA: MiaB/RimO family radical SAM methylthiotransferase [Coriobacteriia bacterium]
MDDRRPRIALRTLGCKVNRTESEALADALSGECDVLMDTDATADVVVVNTCTVTGEADAKARKAVRHALSGGSAAVVVTGCLAAVDPDGLRALDPRVIVEADRTLLARRVASIVGASVGESSAVRRSRTRVMVKVQDGCDRRCSYCIVPDARGLPTSVATTSVIRRVAELAASNTPEVVLTGINIGRYRDGDGAPDLAALVGLVAETGIGRVRISSIEPLDLDERLLSALSAEPAVVPHLHVPLQSGCDRTLAEMGRGYDSAHFADILRLARHALPGLSVTTDVIVGFPGETDDDFAASMGFIERAGFTRLHVFRYSPRRGTAAAHRGDQVPPGVRSARADAMRGLSDRLLRAYARTRVGSVTTVCVERTADGRARGTADDSLQVDMPVTGLVRGSVARVRIEGIEGRGLVGTVLESEVR